MPGKAANAIAGTRTRTAPSAPHRAGSLPTLAARARCGSGSVEPRSYSGSGSGWQRYRARGRAISNAPLRTARCSGEREHGRRGRILSKHAGHERSEARNRQKSAMVARRGPAPAASSHQLDDPGGARAHHATRAETVEQPAPTSKSEKLAPAAPRNALAPHATSAEGSTPHVGRSGPRSAQRAAGPERAPGHTWQTASPELQRRARGALDTLGAARRNGWRPNRRRRVTERHARQAMRPS